MTFRAVVLFLGVFLLLAIPSTAKTDPQDPEASPTVVHYQGRFTDPGGIALEGPVSLRFRLYTASSGGGSLWSEEHPSVNLNEGVGSVLLGSLNAFPGNAFSGTERYLEIELNDETLSPRLRIAAVPYALEAGALDGKTAADFDSAGAAQSVSQGLVEGDATPPNQGSNLVHWENLTGVPEGFADGVDEGSEVLSHSELADLLQDDHPQYLLRLQAATGDATPPNSGSNLLHWDNLVGVPDDFADGRDAVFSGNLGSLTTDDIEDSTLTGIDVAARGLQGINLAQATVTGNELALETIDGDHILDDGIRSADILDGTLRSEDFGTGEVDQASLATDAVTSDKIVDGSVTPDDLSFPAGDITGVFAGAGLNGGSDTGDATLSVSTGSGISITGNSVSLSPSYVSGSAYDGRFISRTSPNWVPTNGAVAVSGGAFRPASNTGKFTVAAGEGYLYIDAASNSGAEDEFTAPIQLPHGGTLTGLYASYWDNTGASLEISLWRARQDGSGVLRVASITSSEETGSWSTAFDITISQNVIDNVEFIYWLVADFPTTPQGIDLRLLSARVQYTTTSPQ